MLFLIASRRFSSGTGPSRPGLQRNGLLFVGATQHIQQRFFVRLWLGRVQLHDPGTVPRKQITGHDVDEGVPADFIDMGVQRILRGHAMSFSIGPIRAGEVHPQTRKR